LPFEQAGVALVDTRKNFFWNGITTSRFIRLTWQEHVPPLDCQGFRAPLSPPAGLTFLERAADWRNQKYSSQIFDTLVGLEARAVSESETEAERLRARARRVLELARAINDPEAALRLKTLAADLLERADAIERDGES
jgi:hypothetical protein